MNDVKHEWRKKEKNVYLPPKKPEIIVVPAYNFVTVYGEGNPNSPRFTNSVKALFALSYGLKMTLKKSEDAPAGYMDYTVYPLEGVYDINEEAKKKFTGTINKDDFVYKLMIRQPNFIDKSLFQKVLDITRLKKPEIDVDGLDFEVIEEGRCIQMLHVGSFEDEPKTFEVMERFAKSQGVVRSSKKHREIYLNDFRKVVRENLKTVLRFNIHER